MGGARAVLVNANRFMSLGEMNALRLPDGFLDELKSRLRPSDVIGRKVKLKRQGKEWVGLSPFTSEKTPSFYVNDAKGIFKDFSSGLGGDIIMFLMETERLEFMDAVERLAAEAGMEIPKATAHEAERYDRLARLKQACAVAAEFFEDRLASACGTEARGYLLDRRGLDPTAWKRWQLGYAMDDWRALYTHLRSGGFSEDEIIGAGLAKRSDKGGEPYDVFRNRIIFPIADARGDIIAFGGRALDPADKAKYLNSPDSDLFHKSQILYNFKRAREALGYGERGGLIVCEGYMDVIALSEAGFANAVAPLGTALTPDQLQLLWKAGPDPVMCFDGDAAGQRAAGRAIDTALPHVLPDRSVYFCKLPEGEDPDDVLGQPGGREKMTALLAGALPMIEMLWRRERDAEPLDTPERKAGLEARLKQAAGRIDHQGVSSAYARDLLARMRDHFWQQLSAHRRKGKAASTLGPLAGEGHPARTAGLGLVVRAAASPELIDHHGEMLAAAHFPDADVEAVRDAIFDLAKSGQKVDRKVVCAHLTHLGKLRAVSLLQDYPESPVLIAGTPQAREWLIALEHFVHSDDPDPAATGSAMHEADLTPEAWRLLHRRAAERPARLARLNEAAEELDRN